jgi:hypothetical protein
LLFGRKPEGKHQVLVSEGMQKLQEKARAAAKAG